MNLCCPHYKVYRGTHGELVLYATVFKKDESAALEGSLFIRHDDQNFEHIMLLRDTVVHKYPLI
jgi:hypothetical protein